MEVGMGMWGYVLVVSVFSVIVMKLGIGCMNIIVGTCGSIWLRMVMKGIRWQNKALGTDLQGYVWVFAVFSVVLVAYHGTRDWLHEHNYGYVWVHIGMYGYETHQVASECRYMQVGTGMCGYVEVFVGLYCIFSGFCDLSWSSGLDA
jgi:hypothetical protein